MRTLKLIIFLAMTVTSRNAFGDLIAFNDFNGQSGRLQYSTNDPNGLISSTTPEIEFEGKGTGQLEASVTFQQVDLSNYRNVSVSFDVRSVLTDITFEPPNDFFSAKVTTDLGEIQFPVSLSSSGISHPGNNSIDISDNASWMTLQFAVSLSGTGEQVFVDNVQVHAVPEAQAFPILIGFLLILTIRRNRVHSVSSVVVDS